MPHDYIADIKAFAPRNAQEEADRGLILWYASQYPGTILTRENEIAHITSSGFIVNPGITKALMVHHTIRDCWAWTGGHADGDADLLSVAIREAKEETGIHHVAPLTEQVASLDILPVFGHIRRGHYVSAHLHLSVAYLLVCEEGQALRIKPGENTGVQWLDISQLCLDTFDRRDVYLYQKLVDKARCISCI